MDDFQLPKQKIQSSLILGDSINLQLEKKGCSLSSLAKKSNVNKSTLHGWINGIIPRSLTEVIKVANALEISMDELCFGTQKNAKSQTLPITIRVTIESE